MDLKTIEIKKILDTQSNFNINSKIKNIKEIFNIELKGFKYVDDKQFISTFKNKYIRYVSFNNKLYYGGFFYKTENINGKLFIYLINKNKIPWKIDYDQYYIFYINHIRTKNESKRNIYDIFIKDFEHN
jgi:hypothetical protein